MKNRLFRAFLCMLLICCILINLSPIRAKATLVATTTGYIITVNVTPVVASILTGLGVGAIAASTGVFDSLVADCVSHLQEIGLCDEFSIDVFGYEIDGYSLFGITPRIIEAIRSWLYDSGTVTQSTIVSTTGYSASVTSSYSAWPSYRHYAFSYGLLSDDKTKTISLLIETLSSGGVLCYSTSNSYLHCFGFYNNQLCRLDFANPLGKAHASLLGVYSEYPGDVLGGQKYNEYDSVFFSISDARSYFGDNWLTSSYYVVNINNLSDISDGRIFTFKGYYYKDSSWSEELYYTSSKDVTFSTQDRLLNGQSFNGSVLSDMCYFPKSGYITWGDTSSTTITVAEGLNQGSIALQDESLEVGYPDWYSNSKVLTTTDKQQVQVYPFPYSNALSDYYTATQSGIWSGSLTNTGTGSDSDINSGTNSGSWTPPSDPGAFALDLTSFFPFCIPFDLYDFLTCLNADPVAPVINWDLSLPGIGTYPITIDLSPFDSVAQLLRRLQLLLFIIGLAVKTRDLIKG